MFGITILISAIIALAVVAVHRVVAQKRATVDVLLKLRTDRDFLDADSLFRQLELDDELSRIFGDNKTDRNAQIQIKNYLNVYELICCSIKGHVIEEDICHELVGETIKKRWKAVQSHVTKLREQEGNMRIFSEFEEIATCWEKNQRCVTRHKIIEPFLNVVLPPKNHLRVLK